MSVRICHEFDLRSQGHVKLELEKAKSHRAIALDVSPQVADVGLLAEGPECSEPDKGNLLYIIKC